MAETGQRLEGGSTRQRERIYYPQFAATLKVRLEDFVRGNTLDEYHELTITPKRATVHINDYTSADTFELEIDYKALPFDPRCIRSCGVTIHAEDMFRNYEADGSHPKITPSEENTIFQGFADEDSLSFNDSTRTVRLEGRDLTCLFIDHKYPLGTVPLTKRVDEVLRFILDLQPATKPMKIENRVLKENGAPEVLPILSSFYTDKQEGSGQKNVKRDETYWDVINDVVRQAGLIAFVELDKLIIAKPRTLYDKHKAKTFVYGRNIKDLEFKRKLGRRKMFNVIARGLNIEGKNPPVYTAKIPEDATSEWTQATGIAKGEVKIPELDAEGKPIQNPKAAPYMAFLIPNVASKKQLVEIGQQIYEEVSRQEIEGSFSTREMSVPVASSFEDFNVLKLRNGTPITITIDQGDVKGISNLASEEERKNFLIARGWQPKVAAVFASTLGKYSNTFYTKAVKINMSADDGISFDVEFLNFIEVSEKFRGSKK